MVPYYRNHSIISRGGEKSCIMYDAKRNYYTIRYDDNDIEELTHKEVARYWKLPKQDSTTRHEQVEKEY